MHPLDLARRLALEADGRAFARGPQGRTLVRPAAVLRQPYDFVTLNFPSAYLTLAPSPGGTSYADSDYLTLDPMLPLSPYPLLWAEPQSLEVDDATLGGAFLAFVSLKLDNDDEFGLNAMQLFCDYSGYASVSGPWLNDTASLGRTRKIKQVRIRLQADPPGTATATLPVGPTHLYLFRSPLGRSMEFPRE